MPFKFMGKLLSRHVFFYLLVGAFLCYGGHHMRDLGFYEDDWTIFARFMATPEQSWGGRMAALARAEPKQLYRPFDIVLWASLFSSFRVTPLFYQIFSLFVHTLLGFSVYTLLRRYRLPAGISLLAGLFFIAYPSKDSTMFWCLNVIGPVSLLFWLSAFISHLRYVKGDGEKWRWMAASGLLMSLATYDQTFVLLPLWVLVPDFFQGSIKPRVRRSLITGACVTGVFLTYKMILAPRLWGIPFEKVMEISFFHFLKTYVWGVEANFGFRLIWHALISLGDAIKHNPVIFVCALIFPWTLRQKLGGAEVFGSRQKVLILLGGGIFILGYLPIAISDYLPTPLNHQNRLNFVPVLGIVLALTGLFYRYHKRRYVETGARILVALTLAVHVGLASQWVEAHAKQRRIEAMVRYYLPIWPADKILIVNMKDHYVRDKAPIFVSSWSISGAVRVWTGDVNRSANIITHMTEFLPKGIKDDMGFHPYSKVRFLDVTDGRFGPVNYENFNH